MAPGAALAFNKAQPALLRIRERDGIVATLGWIELGRELCDGIDRFVMGDSPVLVATELAAALRSVEDVQHALHRAVPDLAATVPEAVAELRDALLAAAAGAPRGAVVTSRIVGVACAVTLSVGTGVADPDSFPDDGAEPLRFGPRTAASGFGGYWFAKATESLTAQILWLSTRVHERPNVPERLTPTWYVGGSESSRSPSNRVAVVALNTAKALCWPVLRADAGTEREA